jgi:GntR family transcriptional regulator
MRIPIHLTIYEDIKKDILNGKYKPNEAIASERNISVQYDVSRMTVRQAINQLVFDGYLYRKKGSGTYVSEKVRGNFAKGVIGFEAEMERRGYRTTNQELVFQKELPSAEVAKALEIETYEGVYRIERIRYADGEPMAYELTHRAVRVSPDLTDLEINRSLMVGLETAGYEIGYADQSIHAVLATEEQAGALGIEVDGPLLLVCLIIHSSSGNVLQYSRLFYRADRYSVKQVLRP